MGDIMRILVAEDTDDCRALLRALLEFRGHQVLEACDGIQAVQVAIMEQPELILMDVRMPRMDGYQATRTLRQLKKFENVPIIAVSACVMDDGDEAKVAGCNESVLKPRLVESLEEVIRRYSSTLNAAYQRVDETDSE
jgi:CheY-like chemotaxis protein